MPAIEGHPCKQNYADLGIRAFWLDEAEPEFTTCDFENYTYQAGPVAAMGNIYPREYARLFYEGQRAQAADGDHCGSVRREERVPTLTMKFGVRNGRTRVRGKALRVVRRQR